MPSVAERLESTQLVYPRGTRKDGGHCWTNSPRSLDRMASSVFVQQCFGIFQISRIKSLRKRLTR